MPTSSIIESEGTSPKISENDKDPEGFLKQCSGFTQGSAKRCKHRFSRRQRVIFENSTLKYLPTCNNHTEQRAFAGTCKHIQDGGTPCGRLFRWRPPYLELCPDHASCPNTHTPCYFLKLPTEIRLMIFGYLAPDEPIRNWNDHISFGPFSPYEEPISPKVLLNISLVSRQISLDVQGLIFSTVPFVIDIRDGLFMCGLKLLQPTKPDGSPHLSTADKYKEMQKSRFIKNFNFRAVRNYQLEIRVQNVADHMRRLNSELANWDEEVELYDVRDYVAVAVSGILAKAERLSRLEVRLCVSGFNWTQGELLENAKCVLGPLERLRNVLHTRLYGVYGDPISPTLGPQLRFVQRVTGGFYQSIGRRDDGTRILLGPGSQAFDEYKTWLEGLLTQRADTSMVQKSRVHAMFIGLKDFYSQFLKMAPSEVTLNRIGRYTFLHRARVAREREDVETFRLVENELVQAWLDYLERMAKQKQSLSRSLVRMLAMDTYPTQGQGADSVIDSSAPVPGADLKPKSVPNEARLGPARGGPLQSQKVIQRVHEVIKNRNAQRPIQENYTCAAGNPANLTDPDKVAAFDRLMDSTSKHIQAPTSSVAADEKICNLDEEGINTQLQSPGQDLDVRMRPIQVLAPGACCFSLVGGSLHASGTPTPLPVGPDATARYQDGATQQIVPLQQQ